MPIKKGTELPEGADLNNYVTPGKFFSSNTAHTSTLLNCPVIPGFSLYVVAQGNGGVLQLITQNTNSYNLMFYRTKIDGVWSNWFHAEYLLDGESIARQSDLAIQTSVPTSDYGTFAANCYVKRSGNVLSAYIALTITKAYTAWTSGFVKFPDEFKGDPKYTLMSVGLQGSLSYSSILIAVADGQSIQFGANLAVGDIIHFGFTVVL